MKSGVERFERIAFLDAEFVALPGHRPTPVCLVVRFSDGKVLRFWQDELLARKAPPFDLESTLVVAFFASAEMLIFLALGWPVPKYVIDLYVEFREQTNGVLPKEAPRSLLGALHHFGLPAMDVGEKKAMRDLILRGGWNEEEQQRILKYCEADVVATVALWSRMSGQLNMAQAVLRGRYMIAVARMEHLGIPVDVELLDALKEQWEKIQLHLVRELDEFKLFDGTTFKQERFERFLVARGWSWPSTKTERLDLRSDTFGEMSMLYPELRPLHNLRNALSKLRPNEIAVGADGRHRTLLSPFSTSSSRHAPSTTRFIFNAPAWARSLIRPEPRMALAYIDWSQQEFGIAAALSDDKNMIDAYNSGDPYLAFGKKAGLIPPSGTKKTHPNERGLCKTCVLGVQYSMGAEALAIRLGRGLAYAIELLNMHRRVFRRYWEWTRQVLDHAVLHGWSRTRLGWTVRTGLDPRPTSLTNFPMQANGAELLRLVIIGGLEQGQEILAPVHDAFLLGGLADEIDERVESMKTVMAKVSELYLGSVRLRADATIVRFPDRYVDEDRGRDMWNTVMAALKKARGS